MIEKSRQGFHYPVGMLDHLLHKELEFRLYTHHNVKPRSNDAAGCDWQFGSRDMLNCFGRRWDGGTLYVGRLQNQAD